MQQLGKYLEIQDELFDARETFVIALHGAKTETVNEARYRLFWVFFNEMPQGL